MDQGHYQFVRGIWKTRSRQDEHLRSYRRNSETSYSLLTHDGPFWKRGISRRQGDSEGCSELAFSAQREPSIFEVRPRHPNAVIPQDEKLIRPVIIDLYATRIGVVRILEQFTDSRWNSRNLLTPQHVERTSTNAYCRHVTRPNSEWRPENAR